jgi:hypothetical protein
MSDPFDLQRFLDAQAPVYARVVTELRRGQKQSHWMWFIFPQFAGLGHSAMAHRRESSGPTLWRRQERYYFACRPVEPATRKLLPPGRSKFMRSRVQAASSNTDGSATSRF